MNPEKSIKKFINAVSDFLDSLEDHRLKPYLADWPTLDVGFRSIAPCSLPVLAFMDAAVKTASPATERVVSRFAALSRQTTWGQTYAAEDFGAGFLEKYGWTEFIGLRGPIPNQHMACGILMLGPDVAYPLHRHEAEEVYIPLTGETRWQQGDQEWTLHPLGLPIYHAPWVPHAMRTNTSPLLALYLWRAGDLTQKSLIGGCLR